MKNVEVLLREHVPNLGRCGDVVHVAAGYARNYLLPKRIAVEATSENRRMMQRRARRLEVEEAAHAAETARKVEVLSALELRTSGKADETGHLYGSVSAKDVAALLAAQGWEMEERHVRLEAPIKTVGTHVVGVHVHGEHHAEVTLVVEAR